MIDINNKFDVVSLKKARDTLYSSSLLEWTKWIRRIQLSSKGMDQYIGIVERPTEWKNERWKRWLSESERERSRCIDRRHKIHFMTWTLSSDWCISRRIASQIKRSSTLEPPLTISPGPRRRRTMPSTLVSISLSLSFSLSACLFIFFFRDTRRQVYRQNLTS